jgi:hypothetical protein
MTVVIKEGVYNVGIGDTSSGGDALDFNFEDNDTVFLNVEVAAKVGDTCGSIDGAESFETLNPRQRLFASGFAINADSLDGFHASQNPVANQIPVLQAGDLVLSGTVLATGFMAKEMNFSEEFIRERFDRTADTAGGSVNGFGDTFAWGLGEMGSCSWSILDDATNGILRQSTTGGGVGGGGKACLTYLSAALQNRHDILKAVNNPILAIKLKPSQVGADNWVLAGMMDYDDGETNLPENGIYFSSEGGTNWKGVSRVGGSQTTVDCVGQTILTSSFAYLYITVSSSTVEFSLDNNSLDGINPVLCGSSSTTTPAINLTAEIMNQARAGESINLVSDFLRLNQDDTEDASESLAPGEAGAGSGADIAEETPAVDPESIGPGDLLSLVSGNILAVRKSAGPYDNALYGIRSTDPGLILGNGLADSIRVALFGRVPLKVNLEGGPIEVNDWLTSSSEAGVAMKASRPGMVIGRALEPFSSLNATSTLILASIEPQERGGSNEGSLGDALVEFLGEIRSRFISVVKLVAEEIESLSLRAQKLEIGSPESPGSLIIYDSATREPYCLKLENGELKSAAGDCDATSGAEAPSSPPSAESPVPEAPGEAELPAELPVPEAPPETEPGEAESPETELPEESEKLPEELPDE